MSTKEQMTPEQIILVQELVELYTPRIGDDEVGMLYKYWVELYQTSIETGIFDGQIFDKVEDEYAHMMSFENAVVE